MSNNKLLPKKEVPQEAPVASAVKSRAASVVGVVTGYSMLSQMARAGKQGFAGVKGINEELSTGASGLNADNRKVLNDLRDGLDERTGGEKAKYKVYSPRDNCIYYGDNFKWCMNDAFSKEDIALLISQRRLIRRIQAYGALVVYITALLVAIGMGHLFPLFSMFPGAALVAFALKRGCQEQTLIQMKPCGVADYINGPGIFGLWK